METLSPVPRGLYDSVLAGGADERGNVFGERLVSFVVLDSRVDHLLLAENGELVRTQDVIVVLDERVTSSVSGCV